jgi:MFS family permease
MERPHPGRPNAILARPWLAVFVPINAATSGFGVALPLLILVTLGAAWTEVALAATLVNIAVIFASIFWGWVSDRYPTRRRLLLLNYAGYGVLYIALSQTHTVGALLAVYALIGLITPAGSNAASLLILEKFSAEERPSAYASYQLMSIIGGVAGLLTGFFWLSASLPLPPLLLVLAALCFASVVGVWFGVREPKRSLATIQVARHVDSLSARVAHPAGGRMLSVPFFPRRPDISAAGYRRLQRWIREEAHHELPLILAASFLFNMASNLFNISYTPYLYSVGIGAASIFLVNLSNNVAQGFLYPTTGTMTNRVGADRLVRESTYVRSLGYLAVAGFTFIPMVVAVAFVSNVIAFGILGGAIAFYSTTSGIILYRALEGRDAGTLLGFNSALGGIAAVLGAALSGVLSVFGSYRLTFLVSAGCLLASLPLWSAATISYARRHPERSVLGRPRPRPAPPPAAPQSD